MFICSISQNPTLQPVVSNKSHNIFDEKALTTYVNSYGVDPISKDPMTLDDIIVINPTIPASAMSTANITKQTSIPTMLQSFQDAWDSLSLELFQLRTNLDQTRKELSLALYKQDAAVRVALKASKERDELIKALADLGGSSNSMSKSLEDSSTSTKQTSTEQTTKREAVDINEFNAKLEQTQQTLFAKHKAENKQHKSIAPIKSSDFQLSVEVGNQISDIPNGIDKFVLNESRSDVLIRHTSGQVELLEFVDDKFVTKSTYDSHLAIPLWIANKPYVVALKKHKKKGRRTKKSKAEPTPIDLQLVDLSIENSEGIEIPLELLENEISDIVAHPLLTVFIVFKLNELIVFQLNESTVEVVYRESLESNILSGAIHPDGVLLARAISEGVVEIYDLSTREVKLTIENDGSKVKSICFASNGYSVVIEYENSVGIYDLRKAQFQSILPKEKDHCEGISIDEFSTLIICGSYYSIYDKKAKKWSNFSSFLTDSTIEGAWLQRYSGNYKLIISKSSGVFFGVA